MPQDKIIEYKNTLNLPNTDFPMKANLSQREPEMLKKWEKQNLFSKIREFSKGKPKFILHDGPPYANGHIHIGHCLNKVLKDIIVKSQTLFGKDSYYVPGWDCHGLPIEYQVTKKLGSKKADKTKSEIRKLCREYAQRFVDIQRDEFKRLAVFADWENPYLTMNYDYEATIARELGKFMENGGLYRGKKPVYWCYSCQTALAEAEVEYEDKSSDSVYVKFKLLTKILTSQYPSLKGRDVYAVIWTTTPWTLPANRGLAFHPKFEYAAVQHGDDVLIVADELKESVLGQDLNVLEVISGEKFQSLKFQHPFYDRESIGVNADYVTLEAGTGIVHIAPGHGQDDYEISKLYNLDVYSPVNEKGVFTEEVEYFSGQFVYKANENIIAKLKEFGALVKSEQIMHSYPHCWRCKSPIIFRATPQWFISMGANDLRVNSLEQIDRVKWIPEWGKERIYNMIQNRPDWCVSRQRSWGVPIVVFYCSSCDTAVADKKVVDHVSEIFKDKGSDVWFELEPEDLLPKDTSCKNCGLSEFKKESDILDVWFDSGVSFSSVIENNYDLKYPADMYLEGSDQHRGWFHSSLLVSVGTRGHAPYDSVLTHGFVVDKDGQKMSKSKDNVISPDEIIKNYGAEILRLWVAAEDYSADIRISPEIVERLIDTYRKIRNTFRYLLGNLYDYDPEKDSIDIDSLEECDKWILHKLNVSFEKIIKAYEEYQFHIVYHELQRFCIVDLSSIYLDFQKDILYTFAAKSKRRKSAQTTMYIILDTLTRICAPILTFTAEEVWSNIPGKHNESIFLNTITKPEYVNKKLDMKWTKILPIRVEILKALEKARKDKFVGSSLEAGIGIFASGDTYFEVRDNAELLKMLTIVSDLQILNEVPENSEYAFKSSEITGLIVTVNKAPGLKCERCWTFRKTVGSNKNHATICSRCIDALEEMNVL